MTDRDLLQVVVYYASTGNFDAAKATAARATDKETAGEAWRLLSRINANTQRFDEARSAIEIALQHRPESGVLRLERALVMEQQGLHAESLAELESLARPAADSSQLLVHLARALQFAGRDDEALERLQAALHSWPTDVPLHVQLAQLQWRRGAGDAATLQLEHAISQFPREIGLRLVAADQMRNASQPQKALGLLEAGLALEPRSAALLTSIGVLLDTMDRLEDALRHLRSALACAPDSVPAKRNLAATLLRVGEAGEALRLCDEMSAKTPDDQLLLAYRATALRLLGDARYRELHDYPRLVRAYELRPPPRYADLPQFNSAFARELTKLHREHQRPLAQSLRGGTQTERNLPADNPVVAEFLAMIDAPIKEYIAHLRDGDGHPVDRRKTSGYRVAGSWSVQLQPGGFHTNHVHPQGWLSSAYYVELPNTVDDDSRAGWLKFGEPNMPIAECPPDHYVKPAAGLLVLFPSYVWHGTVPFTEGGRRLTAAFDVVPF